MLLVFIVLCINVVIADCYDRTKLYGNTNYNYYYFDPRTYNESAELIDPRTYKNRLTVACIGQWCVDGQWKCKYGDTQNCYHVEHIIPKNNNIQEIQGCDTNVVGNLIMSYGAWNQLLSDGYYGEKVEIYGDKIVKSAYKSILKACSRNTFIYPPILCLSNILWLYAIGIISIFIIMLITALIAYARSKEQEIEMNINQ